MGGQGEWKNKLYYGDNLDVMRKSIADESIDLIYLDPPFKSDLNYNVLFRADGLSPDEAQWTAFKDTWLWDEAAIKALSELQDVPNPMLVGLINALAIPMDQTPMLAYLVNMALRLLEMHRKLKPTGSLYLHCDPTASHYLKLILDAIFDPRNFRNEIVWRRSNAHNKTTKQYGPIHDTILFYSRTDHFFLELGRTPYSRVSIERKCIYSDEGGLYRLNELTGQGTRTGESGIAWRGYDPTAAGRHWAIPKSLKDTLPHSGVKMSVQEMLEAFFHDGNIRFTHGGRPEYKQRMGKGVPY